MKAYREAKTWKRFAQLYLQQVSSVVVSKYGNRQSPIGCHLDCLAACMNTNAGGYIGRDASDWARLLARLTLG
jgi:hypothetical protein